MQTPTTERQKFGGPRGGNILEFYTEEFKPVEAPTEQFRQHIVEWFFATKHLRRFEAVRLTFGTPLEEDLRSHRMVCSTLITFGEFASIFARHNAQAVNLASIGLTLESIEAETRLLRDNFKMFHDSTITEEESEKVLQAAFR